MYSLLFQRANLHCAPQLAGLPLTDSRLTYLILVSSPLSSAELDQVCQILAHPDCPVFLDPSEVNLKPGIHLQFGPRNAFTTAFSTNVVSLLQNAGLTSVSRVECLRTLVSSAPLSNTSSLFDRMTELQCDPLLETRTASQVLDMYGPPQVEDDDEVFNVLEDPTALSRLSHKFGLGFDEIDIRFYENLFKHDLKRNPTFVEIFDLAQSNSEHSRHFFFNGTLVINGETKPRTLFDLVKEPWKIHPGRSVVAFSDNSSSIRGFEFTNYLPRLEGEYDIRRAEYDLTFTCETHNFPCAIAPFQGAETGSGGRMRDGLGTGKGSLLRGGTAGYCVGDLWDTLPKVLPSNMAHPLDILIQASNGASDYGNKFGEPLINGFARSFAMVFQGASGSSRLEFLKPIMMSGGIGVMDQRDAYKDTPQEGQLIVKLGGPAYRIGVGGGAASSQLAGDDSRQDLDFNAVQRGDPQMLNKVQRVLRYLIEREDNPIRSIHDQGAGGSSNCLKEIADPTGCVIHMDKFLIGDESMTARELWVAEFQENMVILIDPDHESLVREACLRENCPYSVVGTVKQTGRCEAYDRQGKKVCDLPLGKVLNMPRKTFVLEDQAPLVGEGLHPISISSLDASAIPKLFADLAVGSKRFLTHKVDRSVSGLVVQQQCVGPLETPISDYGLMALSYFSPKAGVTAIGESPLKGVSMRSVDTIRQARQTLTEALTNLCFVKICKLSDVRASGNWMFAAKLPGEGRKMYEMAEAISEYMTKCHIAIDGGKDSLSMATQTAEGMVVSPGQLVVSCYAPVEDFNVRVTADLKPVSSQLIFVDLDRQANRGELTSLGGSILGRVLEADFFGEESPDVVDPTIFIKFFEEIQALLAEHKILAGHDRSDGGLITTLCEMCLAGNCGADVSLEKMASSQEQAIRILGAESAGVLLQVADAHVDEVLRRFTLISRVHLLGRVTFGDIYQPCSERIRVHAYDSVFLEDSVTSLRNMWEATSFKIDEKSWNAELVDQERKGLAQRHACRLNIPFKLDDMPVGVVRYPVAILREEGSNGDRELACACSLAGLTPIDVCMTDLVEGKRVLSEFVGLFACGGFSYADYLGSARGWATRIKHNPGLASQFREFFARNDSFSLGVCNGCQLLCELDVCRAQMKPNLSQKFESRLVHVRVAPQASSLWFRDMADAVLPVVVAHREGQIQGYQEAHVGLRYVNDDGQSTHEYPFSPNGSEVAGLTSQCGRHLALMPHPERVFMPWQFSYLAEPMEKSPWLKLFENAFQFCLDTCVE